MHIWKPTKISFIMSQNPRFAIFAIPILTLLVLTAVWSVQQPTWSWSQLCSRSKKQDHYRLLKFSMIYPFISVEGVDRISIFLFWNILPAKVIVLFLRSQQYVEASALLEGDGCREGWPNHWDGAQHIWPQGPPHHHHHQSNQYFFRHHI